MRFVLFVSAAVVVAVAAGCPNTANAPKCKGAACETSSALSPRLYVDPPFGVGFDCVTLGCDQQKTVVVENRGGGVLKLALIRLREDTSRDFSLAFADGTDLPNPDHQLALKEGEQKELIVRYTPADAVDDAGAIVFEHYDGKDRYEDSHPRTDEVPLTTRKLGSPELGTEAELLDFGFVAVGSEKVLDLRVHNGGAQAVLSVGPTSVEDGTDAAAFLPATDGGWDVQSINPDGDGVIQVRFAPAEARAYTGGLIVLSNDLGRPGVRIAVRGTAIAEARLQIVEPADGALAMGTIRTGASRTRPITVQNIGGTPLDVGAFVSDGADRGFSLDPAGASALGPFASATFQLTLLAGAGGDTAGAVTLLSSDTQASTVVVPVSAFVSAPVVGASPASIDFGSWVQNWAADPRQLTLTNTGVGDLNIAGIHFETPSSQISLLDVPDLPRKLAPGEQVTVTLTLSTGSLGTPQAVVLIDSDSVDNFTKRVDVIGRVVTCEEGCPMANGLPECGGGFCQVGECFDGFHDPNGSGADGCECSEDIVGAQRQDIGPACPGLTVGPIADGQGGNGTTSFDRNGTIHDASDIDLYFFRAQDQCDFICLGDDYGADVTLFGPPGLQLCANFTQAGSGCGGLPTRCVTIGGGGSATIVGNGQSGIFGGSDNSEDVTVFVMWPANAQPVCANYRLHGRADGG